ncbi:undecaprenyl-phosphate glucose phosphotransferase [Trinickia mobilis]|uniref:undecaprenyl-phosphate glucose phosphotransferase n=1 Tax=Trinickia mobilis TaxID=2816356 RepID=UPI001F5CECCC|nr:undecaprenyl-phosphate glucose phosphotransferase [Trinickia mobilis]
MSVWATAMEVVDIFLVVSGAILAHMLTHQGSLDLADIERFIIAFNCILVLLLFPGFGLYRSWRGQPLSRLAWRVLAAWCTVTLMEVVLIFVAHRADVVSRLWLGLSTILTGGALTSEKILAHLMLRRLRSRGMNQKTVAIVGPESHSREIVAQILRATYAGFKPVLLFDERASEASPVCGVEVMTRFGEFADRVRCESVDEIWLALPLSEEHVIHRFVREFRHDFINLRFLPDVRSVSLFSHSVSEVIGMTSINVTVCATQQFQLLPKYVFDRLFSAIVLIVLLPLLVFLAMLVMLSSPGPALFRQKRMGVDGRPFEILKFRTMRIHAGESGRVVQATRNDSRLTSIGAFLRRTSLDELPQFINVLMGHMSVVGPRPHAIEHDDLYKDLVDGYMYRYRIKPGITGWAQVNGYRGETRKLEKMETRVKFDLFYMQHWSFWFDMKILLLTVAKGFVGRNAF